MVREMRSFAPSTAGAGRARVLLRNPYADIGLTCLDASRRLDRRADRP
jgi:hypothetical protein